MNSSPPAIEPHSVEIATVPKGGALATERATSPGAIVELLHLAVERGVPAETLERLQALHERVSDRNAAVEFGEALTAFQDECPPIKKNRTAKIVKQGGGSFSYTFADLDFIARTVRPLLRKHGFTYTWDSEVQGKMVVARCRLRHIAGHTEVSSFAAPAESSAGMSEQQKYSSALMVGKRQSLVQALGLTTTDEDDDGANPEPITADQVEDLRALLVEEKVSPEKFLGFAEVDRLEAIPARSFDLLCQQVRAIGAERRARGAKK